jgi:hypothetical protein
MGARNIVADGAGRYLEWGFLQISVANLIIIGIMLALFVLALLLPFPGRHGDESEKQS